MKLSGRLTRVTELSQVDRARMFALMDQHYANVTPEVFEADLAEKEWIIQIADPTTGQLCGFSTQMVLNGIVEDRPIKALFSGDTIIDRQYWGDQALTHAWGRFALSLVAERPEVEWYWFLISQGYKTYRFLPIFFHEYFPRHDLPTPARITAIMNTLAEEKFTHNYDREAGVVRAGARQYHLRSGIADTTPERLRDAHVRYFVEKNPGHTSGDELCCIAPLSRANFTAAAYRVMGLEATDSLRTQ